MAKMQLIVEALVVLLMTITVVEPQALTGCPAKCGDIDVPYPFGIKQGCYRELGFGLQCDQSSNPPKLMLGNTEVVEIKLMDGKVRIVSTVFSHHCYETNGNPTANTLNTYNDMRTSPYSFSSDDSVFLAIGCDTMAMMEDNLTYNFTTGCLAKCNNDPKGLSFINANGSACAGIGCCQVPFPPGLKYMDIVLKSFHNHTNVWSFNPCSYAFIVDQKSFPFKSSLLSSELASSPAWIPNVLDFSIEGDTCETAKLKTDYACKSTNSECSASKNGLGYICKCAQGYEGNPYIANGCHTGVAGGASHTKATWKMLGFLSPLLFVV